MIFLPDTNAFSAYLRGSSESLCDRFLEEMAEGRLILSVMVLAELEFGAYKAEKTTGSTRYSRCVHELRKLFIPVAISGDFPAIYARIRFDLESRGMKIGERDTIIGAHALTQGATIVTRNVKEFVRVPGLEIENWETS